MLWVPYSAHSLVNPGKSCPMWRCPESWWPGYWDTVWLETVQELCWVLPNSKQVWSRPRCQDYNISWCIFSTLTQCVFKKMRTCKFLMTDTCFICINSLEKQWKSLNVLSSKFIEPFRSKWETEYTIRVFFPPFGSIAVLLSLYNCSS